MDILIRYLHLLAITALAGTLIIENIAIGKEITREDLRNLLKVNAVYGLSAGIAAASGLSLWLWVGKPSYFYTSNPVFHSKLTLFVILSLLSIYHTACFMRLRKTETEPILVPVGVIRTLRIELVLLACIPLLASLIARGIGQ